MDFRNDISSSKGLDRYIGDIYEVAFAKDAIPATLELFARATGSQSAVFCHRDHEGHAADEIYGIDPMFAEPMRKLADQEVITPHSSRISICRAIDGDRFLAMPTVQKSSLYNDVWKPAGMDHAIGANLDNSGTQLSSIWVFRRRVSGRYDKRGAATIDLLAPHLRRALRLRRSLLQEQAHVDVLLRAFDKLALPLLVVDGVANLIYANDAGEAILRNGRILTVSHGRLAARTSTHRARLRGLLENLRHGIGGSARLDGLGDRSACLLTTPLSEHRADVLGFTWRDRLGLIALQEEGASFHADAAVLRSLYDLSPAEAELAAAIGHGLTLAQFSADRKVTLNTSRTQLKSIYAKTGVARQPDLARLMMKLGQLR